MITDTRRALIQELVELIRPPGPGRGISWEELLYLIKLLLELLSQLQPGPGPDPIPAPQKGAKP